jgi:hypothetical protein
MKQKTHIARNNSKIDALNEAYLKALDKIYAYESETLYKRDNPQRYIK